MDFIEEQGVAIIANGSFNPTIFQPAWLQAQGIVRPEEEEAANIELIHPEISRFQLPGLRFDIQTERAAITAVAEPFIRAADIFFVTFHEKLGHTPITSTGINYWAHVRLSDWNQRQRYGRTLAPIQPWGDYGKLLESSDKNQIGGVSSLAMKALRPEYGADGAINVTVQPSVKIPGDVGVFYSVNHHFGKTAEDDTGLASRVYQQFDDALASARSIINQMTDIARSM